MFNRRFNPYDSLIAFLFAGFILFAGVSILIAGARAYRSKQSAAESPLPYATFEESRTPRYRRTFTYIVR